jgi:hypothetical protein
MSKFCIECDFYRIGWCDARGITPYPPDKISCDRFTPKANKRVCVAEIKENVKQNYEGISNRICKNCKSDAVEYEDYCGGTSYYRCKTCGQRGNKDKFTQPTIFDRITSSPEVLAENVVESAYDPVKNRRYYTSVFIEGWCSSRKKAIAATVARLKEVVVG